MSRLMSGVNRLRVFAPVMMSREARQIAGQLDALAVHRSVAMVGEALVRDYIIANQHRFHETARRLGTSRFTGHYSDAAQRVEGEGTKDLATVRVPGAIFRRVDREVTVLPIASKYLTIPANAAAYGRRAREIGGLEVIFAGRRAIALGRRGAAKRKGGRMKDGQRQEPRAAVPNVIFFWLRSKVILRQDRSLLPSDDELVRAAELGVKRAALEALA